MDRYIISGPTRLSGTARAYGAKNSVLKIMAAALMVDGPIKLSNVPFIRDVETMLSVLRTLGLRIEFMPGDAADSRTLLIDPPLSGLSHEAPYELVSKMRASIIVLGPLLARLGRARVAMPGGCNIGHRKIDLHVRGLEQLGAVFEVTMGYLDATTDGLTGSEVFLDIPSVGATENVLMAATLAKGTTIIDNAAREPEIIDLASFLNACGAKISGAGSTRITVEGVSSLSGCDYSVIPDRIEVGTFLMAAAISGGEIFVEDGRPQYLDLVLAKLRDIGCEIEENSSGIGLKAPDRLRAVDLVTLPYPGFPTDLQAPVMALLSLVEGVSIITENVFENRFTVVEELNRMGADIRNEGHHAVVRGVDKIDGVPVKAPDLRGGAALLVAALAAQGTTEIQEIYHIDRGYQGIEHRLNRLGAKIERVSTENTVDMHPLELLSE